MSYTHLTSAEVIKGRRACDYLIQHASQYGLEPGIAAKLSSLQADLMAEAEERQESSGLPQREPGRPVFARTTADFPDAS